MRRAVADSIREQHLEKPILIGHSLGGVLALAVAADAPDLVGGVMVVDSLPLLPASMNPSATPDSVRPFADQMLYARLHLEGHQPLVPHSLNQLEERLDPARFFRASRQHLINLDFVESMEPGPSGTLIARLRELLGA
jgi:pimeloyl-ACP methyl ester carboxylesterase